MEDFNCFPRLSSVVSAL